MRTRVLLLALILLGCAPQPRPAAAWTPKEHTKLLMASAYLADAGEVDAATWARQALAQGRLLPLPEAWEYAYGDRLLASYDPTTGLAYVNREALRDTVPLLVGTWLLNEFLHASMPGNDTEAEHDEFYRRQEAYLAYWQGRE